MNNDFIERNLFSSKECYIDIDCIHFSNSLFRVIIRIVLYKNSQI